MIGILMPAIHDLHGEQWLGAVEAATAHECDLICFCGGELEQSEHSGQANAIYDLATEETLDALVIWTSALATKVGRERLEKFFGEFAPIPIVAVEQPMFDAPVVRMANQDGMRDAVSHLIEVHGCQRIAFVRGPGTVDAAMERYHGYLDALRQHGLAVHPELVSPHLRTWTPEESAAWVSDLLGTAEVPDAFVASNDDLAEGVIFALETAGLGRLPVIGFDDFTKFRTDDLGFAGGSNADASLRREVARKANTVSLTTVHAPFQEMGRCSVEVALALIRGQAVSEETSRVPTELVVRRSCGCLPTEPPPAPAASGDMGLGTHLRQALTHPSDELPADWAEQLMAVFTSEMRGESSGVFARLLDSLIQISMRSGEGAGDWSRVLFTLRQLIASARDADETTRAEDAWRRAHMLLTDTAERHHWRFMRALVETRNQVLREVGQQLITAPDLDGLVQILPGQLSRIGIPGCYVALYEPLASGLGTATPAEPTMAGGHVAAVQSRLLIAYEKGKPGPLHAGSTIFPSVQLAPGNQLRRTSPFSMVATPLYFKDQQLGFALFELGPKIGWVYATLQEQLSSALHRLFMVERERAALTAVERIHRQEERQRLASDLHDSVSQALFSMTLQTRALELALQQRGGDPDGRLGRLLIELKDLTRGALAEMRALIFELRPDALHQDGLIIAVRRHADAVAAREGFEVRVQASVERLPIDESAESELFRIVQEAVHNCVKHAQPRCVEIRFYEPTDADRTLVVEVADDGVGFDPNKGHPGHLGLHTMRERTERLGGHFAIDSSAGSTTVRAVVPYDHIAQSPT
jgi:signal transduction histidine kinase/DNA-binding LacI/PurR family transcriptional regulator